MSSKSTGNTTADTLRQSTPAAPELSRQQFARNEDWVAAGFRTASALQQVTAQMSQRAALLHAQAADSARKAGTPMELVLIQSTLLIHEWQEISRFSQECLLACSRAVVQTVQAGTAEGPGAGSNGGGASADTGMGPAGPMVQAWQQMFSNLSDPAHARH